MAKFHSIKVADIYKETKDCSVISFDIPAELQSEFNYKQGQHLTLRTHINGNEVRRSYSLCSSPVENKWQVAVKKINEGLFSTFANDTLKKGDTLDVMAPNGTFFTEVNPTQAKTILPLLREAELHRFFPSSKRIWPLNLTVLLNCFI